MERHPPVPDGEDFQGVLQIHPEIVKNHIPEAGAHGQADDQIKKQIFDFGLGKTEILFPDLMEHEKIGDQKAKNIHEAVPAYPEGAVFEQEGIDENMHRVPCPEFLGGNNFILPRIGWN
jgi:hypothetical protein